MSAPVVSVLLPVLGPDPRYFLRAVRSVLAQTFEDFELLIVEEPSASSAAELLRDIVDPRIRHIFRAERTSFAEQLNCGLAEARGQFVARFDADDLCEPDRLERQVTFMRGHPELGLIGSHITIIDADDNETGRRPYPTSPDAIRKTMPSYNAIAHPSVMFRTNVVRELGGWRGGEYSAVEDYELWSRMLAAGVILANMDAYLLRYRMHPGAMKVTRMRQMLAGTILVKERYWRPKMGLRALFVLNAERVMMFVPPAIVHRLFVLVRIRKAAVRPVRPDPQERRSQG